MSTTGHVTDPNGVDHPTHYNNHPSGVEAIDIVRHLTFNTGSAFKYLFRFGLKDGAKDVNKAKWYMRDAVESRVLDRRLPHTALELLVKVWENEPDPKLKWIWGLFLSYLRSPRLSSLAHLSFTIQKL